MARRPWKRFALGFLVGLPTFGLLGLLGTGVWLRTTPGQYFIRYQLQSQLNGILYEGELSIGGLQTDLYKDVTLTDVVLTDDTGREVIRIDRLGGKLVIGKLLGGEVRLREAWIEGADVELLADDEGFLDVVRIFSGTEPVENPEPWGGLPVDIVIDTLHVDGGNVVYGTLEGETVVLNALTGGLAVEGRGTRLAFQGIDASTYLSAPIISPALISGAVVYRGDGLDLEDLQITLPRSRASVNGAVELSGDEPELAMEIRSEDLRLKDFDVTAGQLGLSGAYKTEIGLNGPLSALGIRANVSGRDGTEGTLSGLVTLDLSQETPTFGGDIVLDGVHAEDAYPDLGDEVVLDGVLTLDGRGFTWPDDLHIDGSDAGDATQEVFGLDLENLNGGFTLDKGELTLKDIGFYGILGDLKANGTLHLVEGPMSVKVSGRLEPKLLSTFGVTDLGGDGTINATITGDLQNLDDPIRASGRVAMRPFIYGEDIRFSTLTADFAADVTQTDAGPDIGGWAEVWATEGSTYGAALTELHAPRIGFAVDPAGNVTTDGEAVVTGIAYDSYVASDGANVVFDVGIPAKGDLEASADVTLQPYTILDLPGTDGDVNVVLKGDDLDLLADLRDGERTFLHTDLDYQLDTGKVKAKDLAMAPTPRIAFSAPDPVTARLHDDGVDDIHLALEGALGKVAVDGAVAWEGEMDLVASIQGFSLDTAAELFPETAAGLSGTLTAKAVVTGTAAAPQLDASYDLRDFYYDGVARYLDVNGTLRSRTDRTLAVDATLDVADASFATVAGWIPVSLAVDAPGPLWDDRLDLRMTVLPGAFKRLAQLSPAAADAGLPVGDLSATIDVVGTLRNPDLATAGIAEIDVDGWTEPGRAEWKAERLGPDLVGWADLREGYAARANLGLAGRTRLDEIFAWLVEGEAEPDFNDYTLYADDLYASAVLLGIPMDSVAAIVEAPVELGGEVVGGISVTGSPYTPQVEGGLHWIDGRLGDQEVESAFASLTPGAEGYDLEVDAAFGGAGKLVVNGTVPVDIDLREESVSVVRGELDLDVEAALPISLVAAFDPGVEKAEGVLAVDGTLAGPPLDPIVNLQATMVDGSLTYRPLGLRAEGLGVDVSLAERKVVLDLSGRTTPLRQGLSNLDTAKSRMSLTGTAILEEWMPTGVDTKLSLENLWVSANPEQKARIDGAVKIAGDWPAIQITGEPGLEVTQGYIFVDTASFLEAAPLELDGRIVVRRPNYEVAPEEEEEPPFYNDFVVRVPVTLNRQVEGQAVLPFIEELGALGATVTSLDASARIGSDGPLMVEFINGEPRVNGTVEVIEGKVAVLRSRFELEEGTISFVGDDVADPNVDVRAVMSVPGATVVMNIGGTVNDPSIDLYSEEYPEETQVFTILLTGRAPDNLSANEGMATAEALAGLLLNSVFASVQLGSISIDPDGSVRVGVPLSNRVYAESVITPRPRLQENRVSLKAEFTILPRLIAVVGGGDRQQWVDIFWEYRF